MFIGPSSRLPAQLAPIWNVYGREELVACIGGIEEELEYNRSRDRGVLLRI